MTKYGPDRNLSMCDECNEAVRTQQFEMLDSFPLSAGPENHCISRCRICGQLWETYAYQPAFSWTLTPETAEERYPGISSFPFVPKHQGLLSKLRRWVDRLFRY